MPGFTQLYSYKTMVLVCSFCTIEQSQIREEELCGQKVMNVYTASETLVDCFPKYFWQFKIHQAFPPHLLALCFIILNDSIILVV